MASAPARPVAPRGANMKKQEVDEQGEVTDTTSRTILEWDAFVAALAAVSLGQLDAVAFDTIDSSNVNAVRADDFHMLSYTLHVMHWGVLVSLSDLTNQANPELHFKFGAVAPASHFMPAASQAD